MKTHLLAAVAVSALLVQIQGLRAQPVIMEEPGRPGASSPPRAEPRQREDQRAQGVPLRPSVTDDDGDVRRPGRAQGQDRKGAQDNSERREERTQQRANERAQDAPRGAAQSPATPSRAEAVEQKAAEQKNAAEQKAAEQKAAEQKATDQKDAAKSAADQKAAEQKNAVEQKAAEQKLQEQKARERSARERTAPASDTNPTAARPVTPSTAQPLTAQPSTAKPTTAEPSTAQPSTAQPRTAQPSTAQPSTAQPTTAQPSTAQPTTAQPSTAQPSTAQPRSFDAANPTPVPSSQQPVAAQNGQVAQTPPAQQQRIVDTIQQRVERREVRPLRELGVAVTLGAILPTRVELNPLPRDIIDLRPDYRDYRYVVSDDEIVIVDPRTRRIVEVVERRGGERFASGNGAQFFEVIERRNVRRWSRPNMTIEEGIILPADAPFYDVPSEIVERNPKWRGYKYVSMDDEVVVVEPRSRRVVQVINRSEQRTNSRDRKQEMTTGTLGDDDRRNINRMLIQNVTPGKMMTIRDLRGAMLPDDLALQPLPSDIIERTPELRGHRYVLIGDDALIVAPDSRRVVDVIE